MIKTDPAGTFRAGYGRRSWTDKVGDTVYTVTIEDDGSAVTDIRKAER